MFLSEDALLLVCYMIEKTNLGDARVSHCTEYVAMLITETFCPTMI